MYQIVVSFSCPCDEIPHESAFHYDFVLALDQTFVHLFEFFANKGIQRVHIYIGDISGGSETIGPEKISIVEHFLFHYFMGSRSHLYYFVWLVEYVPLHFLQVVRLELFEFGLAEGAYFSSRWVLSFVDSTMSIELHLGIFGLLRDDQDRVGLQFCFTLVEFCLIGFVLNEQRGSSLVLKGIYFFRHFFYLSNPDHILADINQITDFKIVAFQNRLGIARTKLGVFVRALRFGFLNGLY